MVLAAFNVNLLVINDLLQSQGITDLTWVADKLLNHTVK